MDAAAQPTRKPWIAVVLSFLCTGLGHIYGGRPGRGLLLLLASTLSLPAMLAVAHASPSTGALAGLLAALLFVVGVYVFAVVDAYRLARRGIRGLDLARSELDHPLVYALLILFGLGFPLGSAALVRATALRAFKVAGASMAPTLTPGDYFLAHRKIAGGLQRGDVVVFNPPHKPDIVYVRRVVALGGDAVAVRQGQVWVNDQPMGKGADLTSPKASQAQSVTVPAGHCFLLGDNRDTAQDSRHFKSVPISSIHGRVHYVYYPPSRFGVLQP